MSKNIEELTSDFELGIPKRYFKQPKILLPVLKDNTPNLQSDITIKCIACNKDFIFSFLKFLEYKNKGWVEPKSCPSCVEYRYTYGISRNFSKPKKRLNLTN